MKYILTLILFIILTPTTVYNQAYLKELNNISTGNEKGKFDINKYRKKAKLWNELIDKYGYPEIPYDSTESKYQYKYIFNFDSISKSIIYNRILEQMSMKNYYLADVLDYQDYDLGKIILTTTNSGSYSDSSGIFIYRCKYRFIIIENKVKVEVFKISLNSGYRTHPIEQFYPITNSEEDTWEIHFKLLNAVDKDIRKSVLNLFNFIKDYRQDYNF